MIKIQKHLGLLLITSLLFIASCTKTDDTTTKTEDADKYVGSWQCNETEKNQSPRVFTIVITKSDANTIKIGNFNQLGSNVVAIVLVSGSAVTINKQTISGIQFNGTGSLSGSSTLNMGYSANDGQTTTSYTASCIKQ